MSKRASGLDAERVKSYMAVFNVLVPFDYCADGATAPHEANLYDIGQKYVDVTDSGDVLSWLKSVFSD
ncbi:hypothetical protein [Fulvimarina sp. MAC8]|uniref:hypothetical protein n=1 Tax=Fulvimarina sp. MAC8 TaxID=3162874 RepID=UPI0032EAD5F6